MSFPLSRCLGCLIVIVVLASIAPIAIAQTTPRIEHLFPAGAQRGQKVEIQLGSEFVPGVCQITFTGDGISTAGPVKDSRFPLTVPADSKLGSCEVRLSSVQGSSAPFPFLIGDLPEIIHTNHPTPLELKLPVTVNSRLNAPGDVDEYLIPLAANEQLVCAVATRAIRSPVDAVVRLLDADRKIVATSIRHRSADALLIYRVPSAGRFTLQIFDFQVTGGRKHIYRATVTTGPWLNYAFPAGARNKTETQVTLTGWNLPSPDGRSLVQRITPPEDDTYEITLPNGANRLTVPVSNNLELIESEPNNSLAQVQSVSIPLTVNGRLGSPGDIDMFAFTAAKGDRFAIDVESAELQFPTDLVLSISNDAGKSLLEVDDNKTSRDPSLRFTAPANGRYFVSVRDRSQDGGDDFVYRLHISPFRPDVTARVNASSLTLNSGQTINLPVIVDRLDSFADELELAVIGLPPGVTVPPQPIPVKNQTIIQLPFTVAEKVAPLSALIQVVVRSTNKIQIVPRSAAREKPFERVALIADAAPATTGSRVLWLAVSPEIPFTLKATSAILDAPRMASFAFPVTVERKAGFAGPIRLVGVEPDIRGTVVPREGQIAADSETGFLPIIIQHKVTEGTTHRCRVMGIADVQGTDGKTYPVFQVAAGAMAVGCQPSLLNMTVEPAVVRWHPEEKIQIQVHVKRSVAMQPITLRLEMPAGATGITCEPVEVPEGQDQATLTLQLSKSVALPPRTTISVMAESSRDGLPIYGTASFRMELP